MARGRKTLPKHIRLAVYERDNNTCQYCGKEGKRIIKYGKEIVVEKELQKKYYNKSGTVSFEIDHIIPLCSGGKTIIDNLILSCRHCNRRKSAICDRKN